MQTDLSIFILTEPAGKVRLTAKPTLSTQVGKYKVRVTSYFNSNFANQKHTDVEFEVIDLSLTLSSTTNTVTIGDNNPTVKTFLSTDTIQSPPSGLTIKYSVDNTITALPSFISGSSNSDYSSITISAQTSDRSFKTSHSQTILQVTATCVEIPSKKVTANYTITLVDPCESTILTAPTLSPMTTTALRVAPETQQITLLQITDTASLTYGSGSGIDFCYERSFSISSTPPSGKTQLTSSMLKIDSTGLITVISNMNLNHEFLGVHTVTVRSSFSHTIYVDKSFQLTITDCVVTNLSLKTPYTSDLVYTIGDSSKEWTYTAKIEPLCPYTPSLQFDANVPTLAVQTVGATTKLTVRSINRNDATTLAIVLSAKVDQQPSMTHTVPLLLKIIDPCLTNKLSEATIPELVAFQGYSATTSFQMQITDSSSDQVAILNPALKEFCGPVDFEFYCNNTLVSHIRGQNFEQVLFSPTIDTAAGVADCYLHATLIETQQISKAYKFNATTLTYTVTPIADQIYYVGATQLIPLTKFQVFPIGYYDLSNYTLHMTDQVDDLETPLDITLLRDLDANFFEFDAERELIVVYNNDTSLPTPLFNLVLINTIHQVLLWTHFKVEIKLSVFSVQNTAPTFTTTLKPIHVVDQCKKRPTINWSYKLPGLVDFEGDQVFDPQVQFFSEAITYNQKIRVFKQVNFVDKPTNVTVYILVEDSRLATQSYEFQIQFFCLSNFTANFSGNYSNQTARKQGQPPTAFIQSIQPDGLMTIRFSTQMAVPENTYQLQNSTVFVNGTEFPSLDVKVQPGAYSQPTLLKMNSTFISFSPSMMKIQLNFENPLVVSSSIYSKDSIVVIIYGNSWFMDKQGNLLEQGFTLKSYDLPQMLTQQAAAFAQMIGSSAKTATASVLASSAVINFLMAGPLQHILNLIRSTQLQLHLLLINVPSPASASIFFAQLMSLLTFQLVDLTGYLTNWMALEEVEPLSNQFGILGYNSLYVIINLGTLCFVILAPYLLWLLVFTIVSYCAPQYKKFEQKFTDTVFFNEAFAFFSETYLLIAMCASLNMHYLLWNTLGNIINSTTAILFLAAVLVFPLVVYLIYTKKQNQKFIRDREQTGKIFMSKFGMIVRQLNVHRYGTKVISYLYLGMIRKLWLVFMLVFMQKYVFWSVIMVNFQALFMIAVVAQVRPFTIKSENEVELFNEFFTLVINYHLMMFTDFVQDPQTRELIGNSLVYLTGGNFAINVLLIFVRSLRQACFRANLQCVRRQNIKRANATQRKKIAQRNSQQIQQKANRENLIQLIAQQKVLKEQSRSKSQKQPKEMKSKYSETKANQANQQRQAVTNPVKSAKPLLPSKVESLVHQKPSDNQSSNEVNPRTLLIAKMKPVAALQQWTLPPYLLSLLDQNNFYEIDRVTRGQQLSSETKSIIEAKRLSHQRSQLFESGSIKQFMRPYNAQVQLEESKEILKLPRGPDKEEFDAFILSFAKRREVQLSQMTPRTRRLMEQSLRKR